MQDSSGSKTIVTSPVAQNRSEGDMEGSGTLATLAGVVLLEAELPWWLRPQHGPTPLGGRAGQCAVHGAGLFTELPDMDLLSALRKDSPTEPVPSMGGHLLLSSAPNLRESQTGSESGLFI